MARERSVGFFHEVLVALLEVFCSVSEFIVVLFDRTVLVSNDALGPPHADFGNRRQDGWRRRWRWWSGLLAGIDCAANNGIESCRPTTLMCFGVGTSTSRAPRIVTAVARG